MSDAIGATRAYFPEHFLVDPVSDDGRYRVRDPDSMRTWHLGPAALKTARQFDGLRTYAEIEIALKGRAGHAQVSQDRLRAFESKLLTLGLLQEAHSTDQAPDRQARSGTPGRPTSLTRRGRFGRFGRLGRVARLARMDVAAGDPTRILDAILRGLPWLTSTTAVSVSALFICTVSAVLGTCFGDFTRSVVPALHGPGVLWLYLACAVSTIFHEGGHALACRAYGVAVDEVGIGLRCLVVFAWTRPHQDDWSRLGARAKAVTLVAGSYGSLLFAALGALLWLAPTGAVVRSIGIYAVLAGTVAVIPTLLPTFVGDAYLALTEFLGWGNLRSRSFKQLKRVATRDRRAVATTRRARIGYLCFALATIATQAATAIAVSWLAWTCSLEPIVR